MNATAAKFDIKNASPADLAARLIEQQEKAADINTPDNELTAIHKEIADLYAAIRNVKKSRVSELDGIKAKLTTFDFSIKEIFGDNALTLFGDHEITAEAQSRGLFTAKAATKTDKEKKERGPIVAKVFESDKNPVFIKVLRDKDDHQRVVDVVIHQGRINEFYNGKSGPAFAAIGKPLLRLKGKDIPETEKNLSKFVQDESKEFAKTAAGKTELTKIATAVFNYVDPKARGKAEPHNEAQAAAQAA